MSKCQHWPFTWFQQWLQNPKNKYFRNDGLLCKMHVFFPPFRLWFVHCNKKPLTFHDLCPSLSLSIPPCTVSFVHFNEHSCQLYHCMCKLLHFSIILLFISLHRHSLIQFHLNSGTEKWSTISKTVSNSIVLPQMQLFTLKIQCNMQIA